MSALEVKYIAGFNNVNIHLIIGVFCLCINQVRRTLWRSTTCGAV